MRNLGRFIIRFILLAIVILTVELIVNFTNSYVFTLRLNLNSYYITVFRMVFLILLYVIAIARIEAFTKWFLSSFLKATQSMLGPTGGILVLFLFVFTGLFVVYHRIWFGNYGPMHSVEGSVQPVFSRMNREIKKMEKGARDLREKIEKNIE